MIRIPANPRFHAGLGRRYHRGTGRGVGVPAENEFRPTLERSPLLQLPVPLSHMTVAHRFLPLATPEVDVDRGTRNAALVSKSNNILRPEAEPGHYH